MKKEEFKEFVKKNPNLIKYVKNNEMTWQKFYEIYDIYGEDENAWKDYMVEKKSKDSRIESEVKDKKDGKTGITGFTLGEIVSWLKNVDLDGLQEGIGNVQRVLGVVQDFSKKDTNKDIKDTYKPRPLYKHFED